MNKVKMVDTDMDAILEYGVCGYKSMKRPGFPEKVGWLKDRFSQGLKIKTLVSDTDDAQGMIEYIPGEYCWRPGSCMNTIVVVCQRRRYDNG